MSRRILCYSLLIFPLIVSSIFVLNSIPSRIVSAQTIPSRTPTPSGGGATATDDPGGPGPNPTAPPTSTSSVAQSTATFTPTFLPPTPEDGFLPTALPCSLEVTIRSLASGINVRGGPGLEYNIVGSLLLQEVRPLIGRAPRAPWWQIELADGTEGWVADNLVDVSGYTGNVPVVEPPALENGATVTPGTPWSPTPRPECTPPPTATTTSTPTPSLTHTPDGATLEEDQDSSLEQETATALTTGTATSNVVTATSEPLVTEPNPTAAPLPGEGGEVAASIPWIPIAGVGLILAAAAIFVAQRLRS